MIHAHAGPTESTGRIYAEPMLAGGLTCNAISLASHVNKVKAQGRRRFQSCTPKARGRRSRSQDKIKTPPPREHKVKAQGGGQVAAGQMLQADPTKGKSYRTAPRKVIRFSQLVRDLQRQVVMSRISPAHGPSDRGSCRGRSMMRKGSHPTMDPLPKGSAGTCSR